MRLIALAEDNNADVELVRLGLEAAGAQVDLLVACDGAEALDVLAEGERDARRRPCALLLDLNMPRVNGLEVLAQLRRRPLYASLPVWVMTSTRRPEELSRARALGAEVHCKPNTFADLVALMRGFARGIGAAGA